MALLQTMTSWLRRIAGQRRCLWCQKPLASDLPTDQLFCSDQCLDQSVHRQTFGL